MYKNFLRIVISGRASNVIFRRLQNVILGLVPRIHAKHSSLDTRDMPEYDNGKSQCFVSENDNLVAQCGRSMIEMLGVLAIIGVLSVGGIAGYSKAMMKFKINKTMQHITEIAANIQTLYMQQKDFSGLSSIRQMVIPDDLDKGVSNQGISINEQWNNEKFFSIRYFGLSKEACFALATADWGSVSSSGVYAIVVGNVSAVDYIPQDAPTEGSNFDNTYGNNHSDSYYATTKYLPVSPAKITKFCTDEGAGDYNANSIGIMFSK